MKRIFYTSTVVILTYGSISAQFSKAELQVAGLTCSLCSKSTENQLKKLDFIDSLYMDIAHATFVLYFKKDKPADFYQIRKNVEDAGFSVSLLKVTCKFDNFKVCTNGRFNYQNAIFCCMNKSPQMLNGDVVLQLVDKGFLSNKDYKKQVKQWPEMPNMKSNGVVYHVIF